MSKPLAKLEAYDKCVGALDKAIELKKDPEFYVRRGLCRQKVTPFDAKAELADYNGALAIKADYTPAHYYLGMAHFKQLRGPTRDQTETREAITEFSTYVQRYPSGALIADAKARLRESKDRLSESEYNVGYFYLRSRMSIPGAVDRFAGILKNDPEYTGRDAVYYQMAQALVLAGQPAAAIPYLDKLVTDFEVSEYLEPARTQLAELKAQMQAQIKK